MVLASSLGKAALRSLRESGLTDDTILRAQITDDPATVGGSNRYKIPYFTVDGQPLDHYRIRHLGTSSNGSSALSNGHVASLGDVSTGGPGASSTNGHGPKYVQPKNTQMHVYVPPMLNDLSPDWWHNVSQPLLITEGEKKALAAAQSGFVCIGLGGTDAWRNRTVILDVQNIARVEQGQKRPRIVAKLNDSGVKTIKEEVAPELLEIDWRGRYVLLVFDTPDVLINPQVQNAAFNFGMWLETQGATVGQFIIPEKDVEGEAGEANSASAGARITGPKIGLDDWLLDPDNQEAIEDLKTFPPYPFPQPGTPREWIVTTLNERQTRESQERIARAVISILDNKGDRYKDENALGDSYYFDSSTKALYAFDWADRGLRNSPFFGLLADLGVRTADTQVVSRIADRFVHDEPIRNVTPRRVIAHAGDAVYLQLNDGEVVRVDKDGVELGDNGLDNMLFVAGSVNPIDSSYLDECLRAAIGEPISRWFNAVSSLRLQPIAPMDIDQTRILLTCLFHMSPWLNRWRGLMLPLELAIAEPNSGKTFLYNLRKEVLTGDPSLAGMPNDYKDWVAAIAAAPALWVCDNLGSVGRELFHKLNDELARLTTDPHPTISLRELYTTKDLRTIPVHTVFAITGIRNPFTAPDLTQRSIVYRMDAIPPGERNSNWYNEQLGGGREPWIAEHLLALQGFFQRVDEEWDPNYKSGFRLAHFEQALLRMGEALGWQDEIRGVVEALPAMVSEQVTASDPIVEALGTFIEEWKGTRRVSLADVISWVKDDEDERFSAIRVFSNSVLLSRYVRDFQSQLEQSLGATFDKEHNQVYMVLPQGGGGN